jgi:hypothetical protein
VILGQDRLMSANKKYGEVNLDDLNVERRLVSRICLALASGGAYVIIRGKATSCFGGGEREVVRPLVSSSL